MAHDLSRPATVSIKLAGGRGLRARAAITPVGLLAIAGLVAGVLLSTAVLVRVAKPHR